MADESIIVSVDDKVSTGPADKFRQMATEAIAAQKAIDGLKASINSIPTTTVNRIATDLNKVATASAKVVKASDAQTAANVKQALAQQKLETEMQRTAKATIEAELASIRLAAAKERVTAATVKQTAASRAQAESEEQARARIQATVKASLAAIEAQEELAAANLRTNATSKDLNKNWQATAAAQTQAMRGQKDYTQAVTAAQAPQKSAVRQLQEMSAALDSVGRQAKLTRNQVLTLQYTASDIVASLGSGISPLTIALQQGPQVAQAFTRELSSLGARFGVVGGFAAAAAVAIGGYTIASVSATNETAKLNNSLTLTGNYAQLSVDSWKSLSDGIAEAANVSRGSARDIVAALADSGRFQRQEIEQNGFSIARLAKLTDQSAEDITKNFNQMADAPTAFAEALNRQYHFLSSAQLTQIRQLEEMGDKTGAAQLLSKQLYDYLGTAGSEKLHPLTQFWNTLTQAITNAGTALKDFTRDATPTERIAEIQAQLKDIKRTQSDWGGMVPKDDFRTAELEKELSTLQAQVKATNDKTKADSENAKVQAAGYEASQRLATKWATVADNVQLAQKNVEQFRNDVQAALKANPNDKDALFAQANAPKIEAEIRKKATPEASKVDDTRGTSLARINAELQKEIDGLGVLKPEREIQQKLDQYEIELASKKITLNEDERESIRGKLQAIQDFQAAQAATDRIYEEVNGPAREYNATLSAADQLLKSGIITTAQYAQQVTKAKESYQDSLDPLRQINIELDQQTALLKQAQPEREVSQQMQQVENQLLAQGIVLTNEMRDALRGRFETVQQLTQQQQAYDSIYATTLGAEQQIKAAIDATNLARQQGIISADQYSIRMQNLAIQAANLRIAMGQATDTDQFTAAIGRIVEGYEGMLPGLTSAFGDFFVSVTDGFADAIGSAIVNAEDLGDAISNVAKSAVQELISSFVKLGIQYAVNAALANTATASTTATSTAAAATTTTAWAPAAALASIGSFGSAAAIGIAAVVAALALSKGFKTGGYTGSGNPNDVAGVVHGGEFVMNAAATSRIGVGNLQALQDGRTSAVTPGVATGGSVGNSQGKVSITVINNANNSEVTTSKQEDETGNVDFVVTINTIENALAGRVQSGRGALNKSIGSAFGISNRPSGR